MSSRSSALAEPITCSATTLHLLGDRIICALCERVDLSVRFVAADLPRCEDCEAAGVGDEAIAAAGVGP